MLAYPISYEEAYCTLIKTIQHGEPKERVSVYFRAAALLVESLLPEEDIGFQIFVGYGNHDDG